MKVFSKDWVRDLKAKYQSESKYLRPFIVGLAIDPRFSLERANIEKWFRASPEDSKLDVLKRLRSPDSQQHFPAYYELVTGQFFKKLGYLVDMYPRIGKSNPDLLIKGKNLDNPIVVEVATVFDDPDWQMEERKLHSIIKELSQIEHYFFLGLTVNSSPIPETVNYDSLKQFTISWFNNFDPNVTEMIQETKCEIDGLKLSLRLIPKKPKFRKRKRPIIGSYGLPARFVGHEQLKNALKKKIGKYPFVKKEGYPYVVALSLYSTFSDNEDIIDVLFGKTQYVMERDKTGKVIAEYSQRGPHGLCKHNRNTRLSGVITVKTMNTNCVETLTNHRLMVRLRLSKLWLWVSVWIPDFMNREGRIHKLSLIRNPHASVPLKDDFFSGYPQFKQTMENGESVTYSWVDEQSRLLFHR